MEKSGDIQLHLDVLKRRKYQFIVPAVLVLILATVIAFVLPPVYKSTATILIEAQEIPQDLVRTTITGYVQERLEAVSRIVLSRENLLDIINRLNLYEDSEEQVTKREFIAELRKAIKVEPVTAELLERRVEKTVAFILSYEGKKPEKVMQVTNYITSLFLETNVRNREEKARTTVEFLENQAAELRSELLEIESQLAAYKEEHITGLPELMQLNLQTMEKLEWQIEDKEVEINNLINRKIYLAGQLALLEPNVNKVSLDGERLLTSKQELELLRSRYLRLSVSRSPQHPDVFDLKKSLTALEAEVGAREDLRGFYRELQEKENRLALLVEKYPENHPDIIRGKKEIKRMKEEIQKLSEKQTVLKGDEVKPDNPAYINLQTRIYTTQMDAENARKELKILKSKYEDYRRRVENSPKVEQKYLHLQRNYANAKSKYQETMNRLLAAKEARDLEISHKGEKFILLEPALIPEKPYKPNRLAILLLGVLLATGCGIGFGAVSEHMDQSVHRADDLAKISGHTILATIPYLENSQDRIMRLRRRLALAVTSVSLLAICLGVVHFQYKPLNILWLQFLERLTTTF